MIASEPPSRHWLLLRQGALTDEDRSILDALETAAARSGFRVREVLFGDASYDAERRRNGPAEVFVLEDEARARGLRSAPSNLVSTLTYAELVRWLFDADRVIPFP